MANKLNNPLEQLPKASQVKFYVGEGGKYATPANWKKMGQMLKAGALATNYNTKVAGDGYDITLYNESQVVAYDYEAEAKELAQAKEVQSRVNDLFKAFKSHEITMKQYNERLAELAIDQA